MFLLTQGHHKHSKSDVAQNQIEHCKVVRPVPCHRRQHKNVLGQAQGEKNPNQYNPGQVQISKVKPGLKKHKEFELDFNFQGKF